MEEKKCNGCKDKHSEEWNLSKELAKSNKRMFIIILVGLFLWVASLGATIGGFLWYLNQYDFESETQEIIVDSDDDGNANYIGNNGDIVNGSNSGS